MSRYVIGDIHGQNDKLQEVLRIINFDPKKDILYSVGDFCDRGSQNIEVLSFLMSLGDSFKSVFGNHDIWLWQHLHPDVKKSIIAPVKSLYEGKEYQAGETIELSFPYITRDAEDVWFYNGGELTLHSLCNVSTDEELQTIFRWLSRLTYTIDLEDCEIMHTPTIHAELIPGFEDKTKLTIEDVLEKEYCGRDYDSWFWDRSIEGAMSGFYGDKHPYPMTPEIRRNFNEHKKWIICGHTPHVEGPLIDRDSKIINIDCGSFIDKERYAVDRDGAVCILNLDTFEWWRSDGIMGRFEK